MATGQRNKDPFRGFKFRIQIDGISKAGFREVSGLDASTDAVDYREGDGDSILKLAGLKKFSNITLKRGITDDQDLWKWRTMVMDGKIKDARKDGQIILLDDEGNEAAEWTFTAGWPTKWTGPTFNATANEVAIDTIEIAHEGLKRVK
ncbi:phage tail protein [Variovorax sp. J22R115]|uniref:phage tail protein n=1 Tax=Variovorax sp. J22R115 TaxID=3053509 RepID=UPI0025754D1B|nr:phage tail protein [Variovorax sp. J22R115]MDM0047910.1 phage tail protein [Variovorax sp. J22R115]